LTVDKSYTFEWLIEAFFSYHCQILNLNCEFLCGDSGGRGRGYSWCRDLVGEEVPRADAHIDGRRQDPRQRAHAQDGRHGVDDPSSSRGRLILV